MIEQDIILYLPWPPTVNSYYKMTRAGQRYLSKSVREFREQVGHSINEQAPGLKLSDPIFMEAYLFPPDRRKRDLDNYMKGLLDAMTCSGIWEDDSQINQLHIYRGEVIKGGIVRVEITDGGPIIAAER